MEDLLNSGGQFGELVDLAMSMVLVYTPKVLLALVTLVIGLWLINKLTHLTETRLKQRDPTLSKFMSGVLSVLFKVLLFISVASMVGIATTSFIAVLGAAGLAIGLALQGSLSNFAGGVLVLIFKPFRVGDAIEAQGFLGTVVEIQILYTILNTFDGRRVVIPNGDLSNSALTNYSVNETRRCELVIGISYGDDIKKARAIIQRLIDADERALQDPAPLIVVSALADSSVNLSARVWTKAADLWPFNWDMQERIKEAFDAEGITIPFPQRDVHHYQETVSRQEAIGQD
ncbi:mechanosensitive ion channel family protein [Hydrocarboniclastica marina]|uniref:Small-conductance mechanosensitive channel n=1 Tax=Hydrocarboniclastica marina TaxID=2259620 RepID=A0A4P7XJL1_9ALTE|nr:mechanosensitive ion channel domain-containing protein [Hydrocarboniclastica marina]MAL97438.1 mechanosensitive ion channel protein MscS [Alteromonadaceae bacterium]QCF27329.1 mechanosensitive ion channel family protein [Hydrocarboniclastica marina]|tara:strand:+ start:934 stop:1797 length:864 start_codon:yes stop_codon:yes gene_type:complete